MSWYSNFPTLHAPVIVSKLPPVRPRLRHMRSPSHIARVNARLGLGVAGLLTVLLAFGLPLAPPVLAAVPDGSIDPTFKSGVGPNNNVNSIAMQSDGKIIVGGQFTTYIDSSRNRITRLNPDGTLDTSFNPGSGANAPVNSVAVQNDGKILIGGNFTSYNGTNITRTARLNSDGSLDTSFNPGSGANTEVYSIVAQNDGKILIGGNFTSYNGTTRNRIVRLDNDGTFDTSFNPGTGANGDVYSIVMQSDGKIIISGTFTNYNGSGRNRIVRLNPDGTSDTSFTPGTAANTGIIYSLALQSDGKIIIGGQFTSYTGVSRNRIARLNADGTLDTSFTPGTGANSDVNSLALQSDGKIIIGGIFTSYNGVTINRIARLNSDGTLDTSFTPGTGVNNVVNSLVVQSDGKVLAGGDFTNYNRIGVNRIAQLNNDGSLNPAFNSGTGVNDIVYRIAVQNDSKIIIGGDFTSYNGVSRNRIARLNSDGSLDTSFNPGTGADFDVFGLAIQNDGKIIIGGQFVSYNGININRIARLNSDGSFDTSFNMGTGASDEVYSIAVQSDGKIIIGGMFASYNGVNRNRIARLNSDGSLDTSFNPGTGLNSIVHEIALQSDGKIIIGGNFTSYNGTTRSRVARLNSNGSLDTSFNPGSGANSQVNSVAIQSDGKTIIGGFFTSYNGVNINRIARLNSNGSLDTSFNLGTGASAEVYRIVVQNDQKILIGGNFTSYNVVARNRIARLNSDGTLDTSFNPGPGAGNAVTSIAIQSDGKIVIGGDFGAVNNYTRDRVARLESVLKTLTTISLSSAPNPASFGDTVTFTATLTPITATGTVSFTLNSTTVTASLASGVATYVTNTLPIGDNPVTTTYGGDASFHPSTSPVYTQTVTRLATSLNITSSPNPSTFGQTATFTATVQPSAATGTVNFTIGAATVSASLSNGIATYVTNTLTSGDYVVSASYSGNPFYNGSTSQNPLTHVVEKAPTSLSLISSPNAAVVGSSVTFTATLSPVSASGVVTFTFNGGNAVSSLVVNGSATYSTNTLPVGTHDVTAIYSGNTNYLMAASVPYSQVIVATCNPQVVTNPNDNGQASICGTFSYALATTAQGTISFALTGGGNIITFTGSLTPTLKAGVGLDGGGNGIVLEGNGVAGDGLQLGGNNQLSHLTIRHFAGRELVALPGTSPGQLYQIRVSS